MNRAAEVSDITIIGGGPVGLFTAFYAGLRQMSVKVIESLPQLGGQLSALYPEKYIYDIAGFPKVRAQELVDNLIEQMNQFPTTVCLGEKVMQVEKENDGVFKLTTNSGVHYSRTIIVTAGNGAFQARKMEIESEEKFQGQNIHYFVQNMNQFHDKKVALFGGGDSAVDWALMLEPIAEKASIIHRRDKFRAHEHSVELLKQSKVDRLTPYVPVELLGDERIKKVILKHSKTEEILELEVDDVLVNYGFVSSLGPIKDWNLEIEKNSIVVNSKMETNIEGLYAVGDICTYEGKVKLIASGFGEAPVAVSSAKVYIDPTAKTQPLHSTSIMGESEEAPKKVTAGVN
ncbi:ferredoxin--NADP(+) reductase [Sporosarcina sp. P12(2017)]|uniref:NAD(P)/FAD-dependent oxidoreductase n=1 Tax=unclassified Sporosarcina TaxID=2647733 RepID=UPI000C16D752|nr:MULTISPECIES: NAD(P)/FAD-dependent oxidoreductase [unclassified Sporosarcina]PIC57489.1 ferredoxin--NADP(+) reductase [Sporosarcina sp. P10]PIC60871.1 ferredoxin--NADP(+) reductase [Sporosarcina sp. P12(2017)]